MALKYKLINLVKRSLADFLNSYFEQQNLPIYVITPYTSDEIKCPFVIVEVLDYFDTAAIDMGHTTETATFGVDITVVTKDQFEREMYSSTIMELLKSTPIEVIDYNLDDRPVIGYMTTTSIEGSPVLEETPAEEALFMSRLSAVVEITKYIKE